MRSEGIRFIWGYGCKLYYIRNPFPIRPHSFATVRNRLRDRRKALQMASASGVVLNAWEIDPLSP